MHPMKVPKTLQPSLLLYIALLKMKNLRERERAREREDDYSKAKHYGFLGACPQAIFALLGSGLENRFNYLKNLSLCLSLFCLSFYLLFYLSVFLPVCLSVSYFFISVYLNFLFNLFVFTSVLLCLFSCVLL